jgi:hypothetical protein
MDSKMSIITAIPDDGFSVREKTQGTIIGKMIKFLDGRFIVDKTETLPADTTLVVVGAVTAWVNWVDGKPVEHRVTQPGQQHPDREELPDHDESLWPPGLNEEPSDPWRDTRYLHLIDPHTGADYTFVCDSYGGRRAVGELKSMIANVRQAHPNAVPMVQLCSVPMKTRFGMKQRPEFKVVGWRGKQDSGAPLEQHAEQGARKPLERRTSAAPEPMNDSLPF